MKHDEAMAVAKEHSEGYCGYSVVPLKKVRELLSPHQLACLEADRVLGVHPDRIYRGFYYWNVATAMIHFPLSPPIHDWVI